MTEHNRVATPDVTKSNTGPALSLHSRGKILAEKPMITCTRNKNKTKIFQKGIRYLRVDDPVEALHF